MTILEKIKFEEDWLSEVNLTKENVKIALEGIRATVREQQTCEDCISRTGALKAIEEQKKGFYGVERYAIDECHSAVMKLPSVTPKQKVGRWIKTYEPNDAEPFILWKCESCGLSERIKTHYCPNCGVDMRGGSDGRLKS